jgi:hypothetical protein
LITGDAPTDDDLAALQRLVVPPTAVKSAAGR